MDPDATIQAINEDYFTDPESTIMLCQDLQTWIRNGGFLPTVKPIHSPNGWKYFLSNDTDWIAYLGHIALVCQRRIDGIN